MEAVAVSVDATRRRKLKEIGPLWISFRAPGQLRRLGALDFGFREIHEAAAFKFDGCHFVTGGQVLERHEPEFTPAQRSKYLAIGYPLDGFEYKWRDNVTVPENLGFAGVVAPRETFAKEGLAINSHVALPSSWE